VKIEFYIEIRFYSKHQRQQRKPPNTINTSQSQRERHRGWASGYLCFLQAFTTFSAGVCEKLSIKRGHHLPPRCHTHTHTHWPLHLRTSSGKHIWPIHLQPTADGNGIYTPGQGWQAK